MTLFVSLSAKGALANDAYFFPACHKPIQINLYANENLDSFPCDLTKLENPPKIFIVGEIHQEQFLNPHLGANQKNKLQQAKKFWDMVVNLAGNNQIYLAQEGTPVAVDGNPISSEFYANRMRKREASFGIEDGFAYVTSLFVTIYVPLEGVMSRSVVGNSSEKAAWLEQFKFYVSWFLEVIWYSPYAQLAWDRVDRPMLNAKAERLAKQLDALLCDPDGYNKIEALVKGSSAEDLIDLTTLIDRTAIKFADILRNVKIHQLQVPQEHIAQIIPKISSTELSDQGSNWLDDMTKIGIPWRNSLMAANTAKLYCANIQSRKLPVVLRTGYKHVPGLLAQLKVMARKSGLNPNLIRTRAPILTKKEGG